MLTEEKQHFDVMIRRHTEKLALWHEQRFPHIAVVPDIGKTGRHEIAGKVRRRNKLRPPLYIDSPL